MKQKLSVAFPDSQFVIHCFILVSEDWNATGESTSNCCYLENILQNKVNQNRTDETWQEYDRFQSEEVERKKIGNLTDIFHE